MKMLPFILGKKTVGEVMILEGVFSNTPALSGMQHKGTNISWEVPYVVVSQRDEMCGDVTYGAFYPRTGQLYPDNVLILCRTYLSLSLPLSLQTRRTVHEER